MLNIFGMEKHNAELIHFSNIANGLYQLGHRVSIYHVSLKGRPATRTIVARDITFEEVFLRGKSYLLFITALVKSRHFIKYVKQSRPDIIYVRLGLFTALYVMALRTLMGQTVMIITEHNGWIGPELKMSGENTALVNFGEFLQRYSAQNSNRVRAVSAGVKDYLISLGVREDVIFVTGNGTDIDFFHPMNITPLYDVGFVGSLDKWQGLEWLVEAIAIVAREIPRIRIAIAGSGPEERLLQEHLEKYSIADQVTFLGNIPYAQVPMIINQFRICVSPKMNFTDRNNPLLSYTYSPLKIRDYAACGKPIIASKLPGLEEIEQAHFGILVDPGDIKGLAHAIRELINNRDLRDEMSRNARMYAENNYAWRHSAQAISQIIKELVI